ncbi:nuclear transport factor 2 family protein [Morganella morganii]
MINKKRKVLIVISMLAALVSINTLASTFPNETLSPILVDTSNTLNNNKDLIYNFYDAFKKGDKELLSSYITDDFIMHVPGTGLNAGEYWGKKGFGEFLNNIKNYSGGDFIVSVPSLAINKDTIFTREIIKMNRKENPDEKWVLRFIMEYKIKDGLISEAWTIPQDPEIYDAFWTPKSTFIRVKSDESNKNVVNIYDNDPFINSLESLQLIKKFYHSFWIGDLDSMSILVGKSFEFYVPGKSFLAGNYDGWEGYRNFREKLISNVAGDKYKLEWGSYAASKNDVFVREYIRMNRAWDKEVKTSFVILHFKIKDGKINNIEDIPVDAIDYDAFFTKPSVK